jgi:hypothetical protein
VHAPEWEQFLASGLYGTLVERELLIPHEDVPAELAHDATAWRVVRPRTIEFIAYPSRSRHWRWRRA